MERVRRRFGVDLGFSERREIDWRDVSALTDVTVEMLDIRLDVVTVGSCHRLIQLLRMPSQSNNNSFKFLKRNNDIVRTHWQHWFFAEYGN